MLLTTRCTHTEAPEEDIKQVTGDETRDTLMAMIKHLDMGVGEIVNSLKKHSLFDNTLLIFLTDNGGSATMHANNSPLRGFKQMDYEGGIHVPFIVSWPAELEGGKKCDVPMWSIDLFATALDAAGLPMPKTSLSMEQVFCPQSKARPTNFTMNSTGVLRSKGKWAIRSGDWKLVARRIVLSSLIFKRSQRNHQPCCKTPTDGFRTHGQIQHWLDEMADPVSNQEKRWNPDAGAPAKKQKREESRTRKTQN